MVDYEIRPVRPEDYAGIHALRIMPGVFESILGIPSERLQKSLDYLAGLSDNDHMFTAVTLEEGLVIGTGVLSVYSMPRKRHSGCLGLMVHRDYQQMGVGTALMNAIINLADNWLKLIRLELTVFTDNSSAIKLYSTFGFEQEGVRRLSAVKNGAYADEFLMARIRQ